MSGGVPGAINWTHERHISLTAIHLIAVVFPDRNQTWELLKWCEFGSAGMENSSFRHVLLKQKEHVTLFNLRAYKHSLSFFSDIINNFNNIFWITSALQSVLRAYSIWGKCLTDSGVHRDSGATSWNMRFNGDASKRLSHVARFTL